MKVSIYGDGYDSLKQELEAWGVDVSVRCLPWDGLLLDRAVILSEKQPQWPNIGEDKSEIVFLLDYHSETSEGLAAAALESALHWAQCGRHVVFLSRFVKTAASGEQLYREARQAGVCFIKYEQVSLHEGSVEVHDGFLLSKFDTPHLLVAEAEPEGEERFYLHPVFTLRRGLFNWKEGYNAELLVPLIVAELQNREHLQKEPGPHAEIDAEKCAFCYSCHRICQHGALAPDFENSAMKCVEAACTACAACVALCPGQAVSISESHVGAAGKIFCCENSAYWLLSNEDVEKIPCGGSVGQDKLAAALAHHDELRLIVCMDDACRHKQGGKRACQQAKKLAERIEKTLPDKKIICIKASYAMKNEVLL